MSLTVILTNADAKIKLLRVLEYLSLVAEDYLNQDHNREFSYDMLICYEKIKRARKLLRVFFSLWNLRKILEYHNQDKILFQKICYISSKFCGSVFYLFETITAFMDILKVMPEKSSNLKFIRFVFWIAGLMFSNVYCLTYLIHSYGKEAYLKDVSINKLRPIEIIQIMNNLAEERHELILYICCNFLDLFIGFHYSGLIEKVLKTRVTNGVLGSVGVTCTILRLVALLKKRSRRKNHSSEDQLTLFDGLFYGYD